MTTQTRWPIAAASLWIAFALLFGVVAVKGTEWFLDHAPSWGCVCPYAMPSVMANWLRYFYPAWAGWAPLVWAGLLLASLAPLGLGFTGRRAALGYGLGAAWAAACALSLGGALMLVFESVAFDPWRSRTVLLVSVVETGLLLATLLTPLVATAWLTCCKTIALSPRAPALGSEVLRALTLSALPAAFALELGARFANAFAATDLPFLAVPLPLALGGTAGGLCVLGALGFRARLVPPESPSPEIPSSMSNARGLARH